MGLLYNNQKPKLNVKGGVIYILKAQNTNKKNLFKVGKCNIN